MLVLAHRFREGLRLVKIGVAHPEARARPQYNRLQDCMLLGDS